MSQGRAWEAPVIVLISCGGYRPGLGPFHSQTLESLAAHVPGIDVVMPATAGDAAGLLNAAFAAGRPTLFFYPKSCLNLSEQATTGDVSRHFVPLGACRKVRTGNDITFVSWGYPVFLCEKAAAALAGIGIESDVLDLRSLSPWDETSVLTSAEKTGRLIAVHEDNHTCGFGAEVIATVAEKARRRVECRRITRPDTFVPCHFPSQPGKVLPSFLECAFSAATEMLDLDLAWETEPEEAAGYFTVDAVGSGPADETVLITEILVEMGGRVAVGDAGHRHRRGRKVDRRNLLRTARVLSMTCWLPSVTPCPSGAHWSELRAVRGWLVAAVVQEQCGRLILSCRTGTSLSPGIVFRKRIRKSGDLISGLSDLAAPAVVEPTDQSFTAHGPSGNDHALDCLGRGRFGDCANARETPGACDFGIRCTGVLYGAGNRRRACHDRALVAEATRREYAQMNLGIAVHLPGDELVTAVVRGADALSFEDFLATSHAQIQRAQEGDDQATSNVQLLITHLGRLPVTNATPILVSPAAGVLFVGAAMPAGAGGNVNLTLGFDHRLLNGVAAAKFVCEIGRRIADLGVVTGGGDTARAAGRPGAPNRGELRDLLESIPHSDRKLFFQNQIGRIMASLVQCDITQINPRQALRNQGLDSLLATELSMALGKSLNLDIPATLVWNYPTIEAIADHLLVRLGMKVAAPSQNSNGVMPAESLLWTSSN